MLYASITYNVEFASAIQRIGRARCWLDENQGLLRCLRPYLVCASVPAKNANVRALGGILLR